MFCGTRCFIGDVVENDGPVFDETSCPDGTFQGIENRGQGSSGGRAAPGIPHPLRRMHRQVSRFV
jgi:hypothetical protein